MTAAVKFGRMSKKQRERVEDEANYHKRRLSQLMDGSLPIPFSDDKLPSLTNNNNEGEMLQRYVDCCYIYGIRNVT